MRARRVVVFVIVAGMAGVAGGLKYASVRDDLTHQRQAIEEHWLRVESALGRRSDTLPSLMEAVRKHIPNIVQDEIGTARGKLTAAHGPDQKIRANRELSLAIAKLLLQCDLDPKVRQSAAFKQLREGLAAHEDDIANERFQYNDQLEHYNARIQRFPDNVVASLAGFSRNDAYFSTGPDSIPASKKPEQADSKAHSR